MSNSLIIINNSDATVVLKHTGTFRKELSFALCLYYFAEVVVTFLASNLGNRSTNHYVWLCWVHTRCNFFLIADKLYDLSFNESMSVNLIKRCKCNFFAPISNCFQKPTLFLIKQNIRSGCICFYFFYFYLRECESSKSLSLFFEFELFFFNVLLELQLIENLCLSLLCTSFLLTNTRSTFCDWLSALTKKDRFHSS